MWDSFWDFIWYTIVIFAFVAYLIVLWHIIADLFRDKAASGWAKAVWVIFLIIFPYLTAIVYLLAKGKGMAERQREAYAYAKQASDEDIMSVAGSTPAQQISEAKSLLDSGAITQDEFDALKAKALS
ncbi:SHOCT domain-containing protein [Gordonia bronchialis]|uniref:SHOCT domain-containing protein n=1 Tax=Gordonia bronchialis TaxID=2054 RepID=UPI001CC08469|nr:SHOCT domain-containing protein [Gordonia bronchialis]UAK37418.1 SHOCT domain-containing protein [Gordonia bronchialis]